MGSGATSCRLGRHPQRGPLPLIRLLNTGLLSPPQVKLEGDQVFLRPPNPRDWKEWSELRAENRSFLTPWEPTWPADALTRAAFLRRVRRQAADWREDEAYAFLTFQRAGERMVGGIGLSNVRRGVAQMGTLGYWVGQHFARRGYTTEAVRLVLMFAFQQLGLHRVEAATLPGNVASQGLLNNVGFRKEGYAKAYLRIDGYWADHVMFAMLREEWRS